MNIFDNIINSTKNSFLWKPQDKTSILPSASQKKFSAFAPWYEWTVDTTQSPLFNALQWTANVITATPQFLRAPAQEEEAKFNQQLEERKNKLSQTLQSKWYSDTEIKQVFDKLQKDWKFEYKPNFVQRTAEWFAWTLEKWIQETSRLAQDSFSNQDAISSSLGYGWLITKWLTTPIWAWLEPVVSPLVKWAIDYTGTEWMIQKWASAYSEFAKNNPNLAFWIEWLANQASIAPVWLAKPLTGAVWEWVSTWAKKLVQSVPKITEPIKDIWKTVWQKYNLSRKYLSWLSEQEIWAIENTSAKELDAIIKQAKETQGKKWDYVQTPYHVWASKAEKVLSKLDDDLQTRQSERLLVLDEAPIAKIDASKARETLKSALRSMNVEDIRIVDWKPEIIAVKWREALLDMSNPSDVKALQKLNEILDWDVSPTQTMDRVKKLQEWAYENKSTVWVKWTSERMDWLIKQVQWALNSTFKEQLPKEYTKILDSMSDDIKLSNEIKRIFGIDDMGNPVGNRGELVMKRLANGTTTGGEARTIAKQIFDRYWIDLIKEARLRQMAMELVWDDRAKTLFWAISKWKSWLMDLALQKTLWLIVDKEWVVRSLAKWKWEVLKKTKPLYQWNTFRKNMAEEAKKPLALPKPSGISTAIPLWKSQSEIVSESKKGLSPNIKRPNGTPLRNSKNNTSSANTQWSKQKVKSKPLRK